MGLKRPSFYCLIHFYKSFRIQKLKMFSRLLLAAALLGFANCLTCKYCDNAVSNKKCSAGFSEDQVCTAQTGQNSCLSKWANNPKALVSTGCSGEQAPTHAITCGNQKCANYGREDIQCFCTADKCNTATTYPTSCDPQPEPEPESESEPEPGNGVEGKAGAVFSVLVATIFAAVF